jgi:predicted RNA-binding Zn ribbon-like protein
LLARDARLYAATLLRLCAEPILPFNYAAAAAELDGHIAAYQRQLGARFDLDSAAQRAQALRREATALQETIEALRTRLAGSEPEPAYLAALNKAIMAIGRATIPLNYTAAGSFRHDPALPMPPLPLLAEAQDLATALPGSDTARFRAVALQRVLNQVAYGLDVAREAVAQAQMVIG